MQVLPFREVWLVDFEYHQAAGEVPFPVCLVALEWITGKVIRLFGDDLASCATPPFAVDEQSLFVAYYAAAELNCFLVLGWPMPARVLDLYAEFRTFTNGKRTPAGNGLLGALTYFGEAGIDVAEKAEMRNLALRGAPYTAEESRSLLDYCESDVNALAVLLARLLPHLDLGRSLLRGRSMAAVAKMEVTGVPIDTAMFSRLTANWEWLKSALIERHDAHALWNRGSFSAARFLRFVDEQGIEWPRQNGAPKLDDDTFKAMAALHPEVASIRRLRETLSQFRLHKLEVGHDGRNRCMLSAFRSKTGRNQPSNAKFIFGASAWLRGLIRPAPGKAIAYLDWAQQEFGTAAALSGDPAMMEAYETGDPYLAFAVQAGAAPSGATKASHPLERERFKVCALAVQYGMGAESLALKLGEPLVAGRELLRLHRATYRTYWEWSDSVVDAALLGFPLQTVFGWTLHPQEERNARALANFPMQANGAEMLRLACCMATERGIQVCAPVHDAILIEASDSEIGDAVKATQEIMAEASEVVLQRCRLRTDAEVICYPDRFSDKRGAEMWNTAMEMLRHMEQ